MLLTKTREDYLETVLRLSQEMAEVRITDLAGALGCRLPTVTRTVQIMAADGWLLHETRKTVKLSRQGRQAAFELAGRQQLALRFLTLVMGLPLETAQLEAQRLKHGLSPGVSARLRAWLGHLEDLEPSARQAALQYSLDPDDPASSGRTILD